MKKFLVWFSLSILLVFSVYVSFVMAALPSTYNGISNIIVKNTIERTGAINAVTAIVFDFRGYDTLGESFVLFTAVSGSAVILRNYKKNSVTPLEKDLKNSQKNKSNLEIIKEIDKKRDSIIERDSIIVSTANLVLPISLSLGAYVILHGHLSPGGGFQGGVLIAGAVAIVFLAYGMDRVSKVFNAERIKVYESVGALSFLLLGTLGVVYGYNFFKNVIYNQGKPGMLYSSGTIFWMNFAVGYKVLAGIGFLLITMIGTLNAEENE
ncbi:putative monovalent cation/H+ antiporter subunit B [Clostridium liquoris]|uniref:Putative monovalent cation/H+ antiporter subunit B n=1 Tax=Clostridium liquoris TaxID=1289519 RepID=A0A2T0B4B2_9CLOT|nr:hydrogen gas-evolving membrane-bound hydrogenase subunit E [Clostridium liquoris]PRR78730.1 putative monovalent cation/H+ antiporter subunit B [Clostridium liquoris]